MRKNIKNNIKRVTAAFALAGILSGNLGVQSVDIKGAENDAKQFPWSVTKQDTTGNYIVDSYGIKKEDNIIRELTQERLLDLVNSKGDYYIIFGGPEKSSSKSIVPELSKQAKENGVKEIYEFDPVIDGYQLDVSDKNSPFYGNYTTVTGGDGSRHLEKNSVYQIWESVVKNFPDGTFSEYTSDDTLVLLLHNDGKTKAVTDKVLVKNDVEVDASKEVKELIHGGSESGAVVKGDTRSDFDYYQRVWNASASYIENTRYEAAALKAQVDGGKRIGTNVKLFEDSDKDGFALRQVTFRELVDILNSPGEHYVFFALSWCHNTQAIISSVQKKAKANGKTVYVYDPQIGNQLIWNDDYTEVKGVSSTFNSRTSVTGSVKLGAESVDDAKGSNNISYLYGELAKNYFGEFITENNSKKNNSISYYPDGDITKEPTQVKPWDQANDGEVNSAIRLQIPFLFEYNKAAAKPITKQWIHKNAANDGTYTEYMLELAWVWATDPAKAYSEKQKAAKAKPEAQRSEEEVDLTKGLIDGLSYVEFGQEALKELSTVLGSKGNVSPAEPSSPVEKKADEIKKPAATNNTAKANAKTSAKAPKAPKITSAKVKKNKLVIKWSKVKNAKGYVIYSSSKKAGKYKSIAKASAKATKVTIKYNKRTKFVKIKSYIKSGSKKVYSGYSLAKKVVKK
ncbi:hypothetical protein [Eubacterium xylanophilum]|uniref:hypothetical protein n=1 Tax=Eubacterium xylanophilum TaxID=39497 RepID=UPI00047B78C0|nr:hypothetical protein [Eubacterium xylanophilum]